MNITFPQLKVGSTFYRNGTLYEVTEIDKTKMSLLDLISNGTITVNMKTIRDQFRNAPGQLEMVPNDIARKEAERAQERKGRGTRLRGRKPMDLRAAGLHDWLLQNCLTRKRLRYQTNYTMAEGFDVVTYRQTPRVDFVCSTGNVVVPWPTWPRGVALAKAMENRPHLQVYVDPRAVRDVASAVRYVKQIVTATKKVV